MKSLTQSGLATQAFVYWISQKSGEGRPVLFSSSAVNWRHPSTPPVLHMVLWGLWQWKALWPPVAEHIQQPPNVGRWYPCRSTLTFSLSCALPLCACSLAGWLLTWAELWRMGMNWASKASCLVGFPGQDWSVWGDFHFQFWGSFCSFFNP